MTKIKKQKTHKIVLLKEKLKFEDYKNYLEAAQIKSKINHLEKKWNWYK